MWGGSTHFLSLGRDMTHLASLVPRSIGGRGVWEGSTHYLCLGRGMTHLASFVLIVPSPRTPMCKQDCDGVIMGLYTGSCLGFHYVI